MSDYDDLDDFAVIRHYTSNEETWRSMARIERRLQRAEEALTEIAEHEAMSPVPVGRHRIHTHTCALRMADIARAALAPKSGADLPGPDDVQGILK